MKNVTDYWFVIEPYVYFRVVDKCVLLYNTLDGVTIESDKSDVAILIQEVLQEENCGVVLLKNERYKQKNISLFINELRAKYMGDIIDVGLSKGKPIQVMPYVNFTDKHGKKYSFSSLENILHALSEINIHVDQSTDTAKLVPFLRSMPDDLTFNIIGDIGEVINSSELFDFLDSRLSAKKIICSYTKAIPLGLNLKSEFSYMISVRFPVDVLQWNKSRMVSRSVPVEYVFEVTSLEDCRQVELFVEQYQIERYQMHPVYTGDNIVFFKENVFLSKEDILSTSMTMKDFFFKQLMNVHDFGKINIMPNGDVYANVNYPILGNIYIHSIYDIVRKEMEEGKSWLRIRNQVPCNTCIYQWLCPSPSDYEISIDRQNLCNVK